MKPIEKLQKRGFTDGENVGSSQQNPPSVADKSTARGRTVELGRLPYSSMEWSASGFRSVRPDHAKTLLARVENLGKGIREKEAALQQTYADIFEAKPGESRDKIAWRGIVTFANVDMSYETGVELGAKYLEGVLRYFLHFLQGDSKAEVPEVWDAGFADYGRAMKGWAGQDHETAFRFLAKEEQAFLRRMLTWLCAPDKHSELSEECTKKCLEMANAILWTAEANTMFDASGEHGEPFFYRKRVTDYGFLMSPIYQFIVRWIDRYHEGELALNEAIPVRICVRTGCGKFLVPARTDRKKFCSTECLQRSHPPRSGTENRDYMFLYRLEHEPPSVLRKKVRSRKAQSRLTEIARSWPELAERVRKLRSHAAR